MTTTAEWLAAPVPKFAELMASSTAKPYSVPARLPVEKKVRERHVSKVALVIHILGEETPTSRAALCGLTRGRAWPGSPANVTLLYDKWCSRCWNRWAKQAAA